jgi:hypothetical protein
MQARYLGTRWIRSGVAARAYRLTVFSAGPRRREQPRQPDSGLSQGMDLLPPLEGGLGKLSLA